MSEQTLQESLRLNAEWCFDAGFKYACELESAAADRIDELERQLAEAREDQARLNWMINNGGYVVTDGDAHIVWVYGGYAEKRRPAAGFSAIPRLYNTPRQAIDAAIINR